MHPTAAVVSLIVVATLGLIVTRVATVALTMTGMTLQHARFQARSAFTGTGFTTSEAEAVVNHLTGLPWLAKIQVVDRWLRRVIERPLRRFTDLDVRDYAALLHLRGRWRVVQLPVHDDDWIDARPLGQLRLPEEGVTVLGVERDDTWTGAPADDLRLRTGDVVVLYGRQAMLDDIADRLHGEEGDQAGERSRAWHAARPPVERFERSRR